VGRLALRKPLAAVSFQARARLMASRLTLSIFAQARVPFSLPKGEVAPNIVNPGRVDNSDVLA